SFADASSYGRAQIPSETPGPGPARSARLLAAPQPRQRSATRPASRRRRPDIIRPGPPGRRLRKPPKARPSPARRRPARKGAFRGASVGLASARRGELAVVELVLDVVGQPGPERRPEVRTPRRDLHHRLE